MAKVLSINLGKYKGLGGNWFFLLLWRFFSFLFLDTSLPWPSLFKVAVLRIFGAKVGKNVVIKERVCIRYPRNISIGSNSWIGIDVLIDNPAKVTIGSNCCISQRSTILTGNHNYSKKNFDLIFKPVAIEDGCWVAANCLITLGVKMSYQSVLLVSSTLTQDTTDNGIFRGNPAVFIKKREIIN